MLTHQVALVSETQSVKFAEVAKVSAALQKQAARDFSPVWEITATVDAFEKLEDVPVDYWPIIIMDDIQDKHAGGYHTDDSGQPFSLVQFSDAWQLICSHECLEMLGDPFGRRIHAGAPPKEVTGDAASLQRVQYLVEVCDPCEDKTFSYTINGIPVSDFITPHYYDPVGSTGVRYSFTGAVTRPHEVLDNGYVSFGDPKTKNWYQLIKTKGQFSTRSLGKVMGDRSTREQIDFLSRSR